MKRTTSLLFCLALCITVTAQTTVANLKTAFALFESDPQLKNAIASLYVVEAATGRVVFQKNEQVGLAPASTQKIITSATAYAILGAGFKYQTTFERAGNTLIINASGDPTLGSWRWPGTKEDGLLKRVANAWSQQNTSLDRVVINNRGWEGETVPDGWIWQDIGNYYGAGAAGLNWRENQFDLLLRSGSKIGEPVTVAGTVPQLYNYTLTSYATSAAKGTGDNAYIYFPLTDTAGIIRGTIPAGENRFVISGAMPAPHWQLAKAIQQTIQPDNQTSLQVDFSNAESVVIIPGAKTLLHTETAPPLDSIVYWFNRKSINLYGEALLKTIGRQKKERGTAEQGVSALREFWSTQGIDRNELNMVDGSGLSPLNRVTTKAQVAILRHAKKQPWYNGFYLSLPEYNNMKMKSGTIRGVKGFTGYHTAKDGTEYVFSFLVNNYNGSAGSLVQKMYKVLDVLK